MRRLVSPTKALTTGVGACKGSLDPKVRAGSDSCWAADRHRHANPVHSCGESGVRVLSRSRPRWYLTRAT